MIDQEGIKSLEKGASDIRLTGNMGESSPAQEIIKAGIPEDMTMDEAFEIFIQSEGRAPKSVPELLEFFKNRTLSEGPVLPNDPTEPVNPFQPKPIGPPLPDREMAAFGGIMGLDQRRQYGLGSSFKRAFNKVTKPFVKVAQKLMPKELAGVAQFAAPFAGPYAGPLLMAAGQAKQRGRISPVALAASLAPYIRMQAGEGITGIDFAGYGSKTGDLANTFGFRDLITGGGRGSVYEGESLFDKIGLGGPETPYDTSPKNYGRRVDEFLFGAPEGGFEKYDKEQLAELGLPKDGSFGTMTADASSGIIGKGGEMFQVGNDVRLFDTKAGQLAFAESKNPTKLSKLKIASWGTGIVAGIQAGKYKSEMEAAAAAEEAALAANEAATEADLQAARDWAIATFNNMSVYAEGGRINKNMGGIMGNRIGYNEGGFVITLMDGTKVQIPEGAYDNGTFKDIIYSSSKGDLLREEIIRKLNFADGGRINKNMGGEFNMPPAGLSSLQTQASDVTPPGMELDLRGGGFIPIGKAEKADDVPARVSKNEFVFTADAVKAAGGGSVNEGAKRMYDTMKRLESQVV